MQQFIYFDAHFFLKKKVFFLCIDAENQQKIMFRNICNC